MKVQANSYDSVSEPGPASRWPGFFIAAAVLLVAILVRATALENHDVSWFALAASRLLHGGGYARDFFEVNMPLAVALYIPPNLIAAGFHISLAVAINGLVLLLAAQSAMLCLRFVGAPAGQVLTPFARTLLLTWLLLVLCFEPGYDFAQREHFIVILVLPFLFMLASGEVGAGAALRGYASLLAAIGFMIKPHYWTLPWLLLGLRAIHSRSWRPLHGFEARVLAGVATLVGAGTLLFFPDWLVSARWAADLYPSFSQGVWHRILGLQGLGVVVVCLSFQILLAVVDTGMAAAALPLAVAGTYALAAAILQGKGWQYHFLPAALFAFIGQGVVMAVAASRVRTDRSASAVLKALVAAGFVIASAETVVVSTRNTPTFGSLGLIPQALHGVAAEGDPVYVFSVEVQPFLPAVPLLNLQWASRYSSLWPLPALLKAEQTPASPEAARLLATYRKPFRQSVNDDFTRYHPRIVFVDRHRLPDFPADYDLMSFFLADPAFAAIWADYARIGSVTYPDSIMGYDIYVRAADGDASPAQSSGS